MLPIIECGLSGQSKLTWTNVPASGRDVSLCKRLQRPTVLHNIDCKQPSGSGDSFITSTHMETCFLHGDVSEWRRSSI